MIRGRKILVAAYAVAFTGMGLAVGAQINGQRTDNGNRLNNPFRTQFKAAWNLSLQDPVKLIDVGPVTDAKRSNLVLLVAGRTAAETQRKVRVMHWNGSSYDLDGESASQSIGIDTLLLGRFHPGIVAPAVVPTRTGEHAKHKKRGSSGPGSALQVLTNAGIFTWDSGALLPIFPRQLPDVKQAIIVDNKPDIVVVGAGDGATPFEFTQSEMRPTAREKLQGSGYAHFGIGTQPFPGSDSVNLAPGIRFSQAIWTGRTKWLIGLVKGTAAPTVENPGATTGDRVVVFTPKFASREKTFWESRMDDMEEAWRSDPLAGEVLDVRVGEPHNDGKTGILVLTSDADGRNRRLSFFAAVGNG